MTTALLDYYMQPGPMTDPRENVGMLTRLPTTIPALCQVVQGALIHIYATQMYGVASPGRWPADIQTRPVAKTLARIRELDARPLTQARPPERRLVANCRHFSVLLCTLLHQFGVPARARCGFATYFGAVTLPYCDHWVCEYWDVVAQRWVMVDAQLDATQRDGYAIGFNTYDLPRGAFVLAGEAWRMCRAGEADPEQFGIVDRHGLWFVCNNLLLDVAALNKMELLPWDSWGLGDAHPDALSADDWTLLDEIAALSLGDNVSITTLQERYATDARLRVPRRIMSYGAHGAEQVDLDLGA